MADRPNIIKKKIPRHVRDNDTTGSQLLSEYLDEDVPHSQGGGVKAKGGRSPTADGLPVAEFSDPI